jgi:hypothetical protein
VTEAAKFESHFGYVIPIVGFASEPPAKVNTRSRRLEASPAYPGLKVHRLGIALDGPERESRSPYAALTRRNETGVHPTSVRRSAVRGANIESTIGNLLGGLVISAVGTQAWRGEQ